MSNVALSKIEKMIYVIRGQKVMLDSDLAGLYGIKTKILNQAIKRNLKRFPEDFMFQLTEFETDSLRSQLITPKDIKGGSMYFPYVFTENGVAMLSSVLNSDRAIQVNISIMRTFVKLRHMITADKTLADKLEKLEAGTDNLFKIVFERLDTLDEEIKMMPPKRKRVGF